MIIRVTLDIRTDLDPATLYHRVEDAIADHWTTNGLVIVAGSAETVEEPHTQGVVAHPEDARIDF